MTSNEEFIRAVYRTAEGAVYRTAEGAVQDIEDSGHERFSR